MRILQWTIFTTLHRQPRSWYWRKKGRKYHTAHKSTCLKMERWSLPGSKCSNPTLTKRIPPSKRRRQNRQHKRSDTCTDTLVTKPHPYHCKENKRSYSFKDDEEKPAQEVIRPQGIPVHGQHVVGEIHGHHATHRHSQGEDDEGHPAIGSRACCTCSACRAGLALLPVQACFALMGLSAS